MNPFHRSSPTLTAVRAALLVLVGLVLCSAASAQSQVDLSVQKTGPASAAPDSNLTFQIVVLNEGPDDAVNAALKDALPTGLTFVSLSAPTGWNCNTPAIGTNGTIVCTNPNLTVNDHSQSFTLVTHSDSGAVPGNFISNKASVSSDTFDTNDENDESTASVLISSDGSTTDLGILMTSDHESATVDTDVTYQISLSNSSTASSVTLTDPIPSGMTFSSVTPPSIDWNCTHPSPGTGGTVTCSINSLGPLSTPLLFILTFHIPSTASAGDVFTNIASIASATADINSENDSAATATTVTDSYSLTLNSGTNQTASINTAFSVPLQLTVSVAGAPRPGVNVTFQAPADGPSALFAGTNTTTETVVTDSNGIATSSIPTANGFAGGPYSLTANVPNASLAFTLTNAKATQTISFPNIGNKTYGDSPFALIATASSGLVVNFSILSGPASISGSSLTILGAGSLTVRAQQPGDANYFAAAPVDQSLTVLKATPAGSLTSSKNPSDFSETVTFSAAVTGKPGAFAPSGTIQFTDGSTNLNSTVTCTTIGNICAADSSTSQLAAGNHDIGFKYSGDANYAPIFRSLAGGQLVKSPPPISISDVSNSEGNSGTTNFDFTISLSATSSLPVTVDFATQDGTATLANRDYVESHGTITFNPGEKLKTITVLVNGDLNREPNETFFVNLTNAVNGTILRAQGTAIILNDDTTDPPQIILEESGPTPNQAAAVDSILLLRDPFSVNSAATWLNLGPDRNTRVTIFSTNLQLAQNEQPSAVVVNLVDANGASHDVPAEDVRAVPNLSAVTQITFRLPDVLPAGPCALTIKLHGLFSNQAVIRIK